MIGLGLGLGRGRGLGTGDGVVYDGTPVPTGTIRMDARAGGAQDIQASGVGNITQALSAYGGSRNSNIGSPYIVDFATNVGDGTKAFQFNWKEGGPTGYGGGCLQPPNQYHEHDLGVERYLSGITADEVWYQWKVWRGKTASGGGVGNVGEWSTWSTCGPGGGKLAIVFRAGESQDGRVTFTAGQSGNKRPEIFIDRQSPNQGLSLFALCDVVDWDDYANQWVTHTLRLIPASSATATDGGVEIWVNGTKIYSNLAVGSNSLAFTTWFQLGGPTWIGPPIDQTSYIKDMVVWQP